MVVGSYGRGEPGHGLAAGQVEDSPASLSIRMKGSFLTWTPAGSSALSDGVLSDK
jgi:hypothetical protein